MFIALIAVTFPFLALIILRLLSDLSGWTELSKLYQDEGTSNPLPDISWHFLKNIWMNGIAHGGSRVGIGKQGIHLQAELPFRPFHPPLLIPWEELLFGGTKRILFRRYLTLRVRQTATIIQVPMNLIGERKIAELERIQYEEE